MQMAGSEDARGHDDLVDEVFASSPLPMCLLDDERRYLAVNDATVALVNRPREAILGSRLDDFAPSSWLGQLKEDWRAFLRAGSMVGRYEVVGGAGEHLVADYSATANVRPGQHLSVTLLLPEQEAREAEPPAAAEGPGAPPAGSDGGGLTERERDVLWLMADGATNAQVALALGIAETTVQAHVGAVRRRLGAMTRAQAVALALRQGVLDEPVAHERVYIHQAIRDADGQVADTRLLYLGHETRTDQREIVRHLGAPMSSWYPGWVASPVFDLLRRTLQGGVAQEAEGLVVRPPWAPEGYTVRGIAIPLSHDRVVFRARQ